LEGAGVNEVKHYEIVPGAGPSGVALGAMVSSFWDKNLDVKLKFGLMYPYDRASRLSAPKRIEVSVTELRKLEALDGSAGKVVFLWGTCRLEVQEDGQEREFFAVYHPDSHWGWMDVGPKLADNYGQEVVDKCKSTYASDN
jgi:hypothetical protein